MRAPSRTRRIAKWAGLVVCVVILAMWIPSTQARLIYWGQSTHFMWRNGSVYVTDNPMPFRGWAAAWADGGTQRHRSLGLVLPYLGVSQTGVIIPLWLPFLLAAIPTAILWHRDRRTAKPGGCLTCGYDLRASKKTCPECGTAIAVAKE